MALRKNDLVRNKRTGAVGVVTGEELGGYVHVLFDQRGHQTANIRPADLSRVADEPDPEET